MNRSKEDLILIRRAKVLVKERYSLAQAATALGLSYNHTCHVLGGHFSLSDRVRPRLKDLIKRLEAME